MYNWLVEIYWGGFTQDTVTSPELSSKTSLDDSEKLIYFVYITEVEGGGGVHS